MSGEPMDPAVERVARALAAVDSHPDHEALLQYLRATLRAHDHWEAEARTELRRHDSTKGDLWVASEKLKAAQDALKASREDVAEMTHRANLAEAQPSPTTRQAHREHIELRAVLTEAIGPLPTDHDHLVGELRVRLAEAVRLRDAATSLQREVSDLQARESIAWQSHLSTLATARARITALEGALHETQAKVRELTAAGQP